MCYNKQIYTYDITEETFKIGKYTRIDGYVDNAVQGIYLVIRNLTVAAYIGGTLTNLVDKIISAAVSYGVYRLVKYISDRK